MLNVVCCTLYLVRCTLYVVPCTLYVVRCTLYVVRCTLYLVRCTLKLKHLRDGQCFIKLQLKADARCIEWYSCHQQTLKLTIAFRNAPSSSSSRQRDDVAVGNEQQGLFHCDICFKHFPKEANMKRHRSAAHRARLPRLVSVVC